MSLLVVLTPVGCGWLTYKRATPNWQVKFMFSVHSFTRNFPRKCGWCVLFVNRLINIMPHSPEEGYNSVRKWTSKFDLFQKKYIVVPINEKYVLSPRIDTIRSLTDRSLHWYLAIIYFPEYTLLPPPVQVTSTPTRRSTRRLGVIIDSPEAQQPEPAPRQSLPPDPGPPLNGGADYVSSAELVDLESPKTNDQEDEFDVERMVASTLTTPVDPTAERVDEQQQVGTADAGTSVTYCPESPTLAYPQSSPPCHPATLSSSDPQGDSTEQSNQVESAGGDTTIRTSGIAPSTFYGTTKPQGQREVTPPQIAPIDATALQEIEIDEDETVGNPDSEPEQAAECVPLRSGVRITTHDLQGIRELTSTPLILWRRSILRLSRGLADTFSWRLMTKSS